MLANEFDRPRFLCFLRQDLEVLFLSKFSSLNFQYNCGLTPKSVMIKNHCISKRKGGIKSDQVWSDFHSGNPSWEPDK